MAEPTKPRKRAPNLSPREREIRNERIATMVEQGMKVAEIAYEVNCDRSIVYRLIREGGLRAVANGNPGAVFRRAGRPVGNVLQALDRQEQTFLAWLARQVPEGGTLCDVLVSCALDAHHDELDQQEAA